MAERGLVLVAADELVHETVPAHSGQPPGGALELMPIAQVVTNPSMLFVRVHRRCAIAAPRARRLCPAWMLLFPDGCADWCDTPRAHGAHAQRRPHYGAFVGKARHDPR